MRPRRALLRFDEPLFVTGLPAYASNLLTGEVLCTRWSSPQLR
ncbi:hypothetical protein [Streptomyces leeuwenhoekii]|nr:hypothetical protein [Streptomyces leeuwenhoekii]